MDPTQPGRDRVTGRATASHCTTRPSGALLSHLTGHLERSYMLSEAHGSDRMTLGHSGQGIRGEGRGRK